MKLYRPTSIHIFAALGIVCSGFIALSFWLVANDHSSDDATNPFSLSYKFILLSALGFLGLVLALVGIKHTREEKRAARERESAADAITSATIDSIIIGADENGVITVLNEGVSRLFGLDNSVILGAGRVVDLFTPAYLASCVAYQKSRGHKNLSEWDALVAIARTGYSDRQERMMRHTDGSEICVDLAIGAIKAPSQESGKASGAGERPRGFILYGQEIRDRKEHETLLRHAIEGAENAQREASRHAQESEARRRELQLAMNELCLAETNLAESEGRLKEVTSNSADMLWSVNTDLSKYFYVSEACQHIFGYSPEDFMAYGDILGKSAHESDGEKFNDFLTRASHGTEVSFEWRVVVPGGAVKWIRTVAKAVVNAEKHIVRITGSHSDITELMTTTEAMKESESRFRAISEFSPLGIFEADADGRLLYINRTGELLIGASRERIVGQALVAFPIAEDRAKFEQGWRESLDTGEMTFTGSCRFRGPDGSIIWGVTKIAVMGDIASPHGFVGAIEDITDRLKQQERMAQVEKNSAIAVLAGGVAHEFKNCLGGILGNASLALDYLNDRALVEESLTKIEQITEKADRIALSLLSYSHTEKTNTRTAQVASSLRETVALLESELLAKKINAIVTCPDLLNAAIPPADLEQVLVNVIRNAAQASPAGSVVRLDAVMLGDRIVIIIKDDGHGVTPEALGKVFDPFFSSKGVWGSDGAQGTGLGLTVSRNLIERSGGTIEISSELEHGATVTISLRPLESQDAPLIAHSAS